MDNAQRINQTSGKVEYYTPPSIIEAARKTMGRIDLDPCSSAKANETVKAKKFYSQDGLTRMWMGRVWMNHPFSRKENPLWVDKLIYEYKHGLVEAACCITFASTSEAWFTPLLRHPQCFLIPRTNYLLPNGEIFRGVTKGSVVTYLGKNVQLFREHFEKLGVIKI